jgi:protein-tyrosine phosphatase
MKILMVCLGNICRSPLAEGIMQDKIDQYALGWTTDSAGTGGWHSGELPDPRSIATARDHGIDILHQRARQITRRDLDEFDHILVMDASNYQNVLQLAQNDQQRQKIELIRNFAQPGQNLQVPDPYYGGNDGFERVFDMLDEACEAFIRQYRNAE